MTDLDDASLSDSTFIVDGSVHTIYTHTKGTLIAPLSMSLGVPELRRNEREAKAGDGGDEQAGVTVMVTAMSGDRMGGAAVNFSTTGSGRGATGGIPLR